MQHIMAQITVIWQILRGINKTYKQDNENILISFLDVNYV